MKKKILFLVQTPPPVHGAALRNLSLVQSKLLQENFNIKLLPLHFVNKIGEIGNLSFIKFLRLFKFLIKLIYHLIFFRPKFIYFTISPIGNAFYRDVFIVFIIKLFRIKLVYHLRGLGIKEASQRGINKRLYHYIFKNTDVICLSQSHTQDIEGLPYAMKYIVPNGIKVEVMQWQRVPNRIPVILFLSNYIKSKGVFDFLESLKMLHSKELVFKAKMVGASWDVTHQDLIEWTAKNGLAEIITIGSPVYGNEKYGAILSADIFVLPTYYELFPGVVLEAMQCGKPIVSTITGAIPEIIDDGINGFLVEVNNPQALTEKVEFLLLNHSLREEMGRRAREKFMELYTLEIFEANIKKVFDQI